MEKREVWLKNTDFPSVDLLGFACSDDGAPPQGHMPIFSEVHTREDPVLVTTPLNHAYRLYFLISEHLFDFRVASEKELLMCKRENVQYSREPTHTNNAYPRSSSDRNERQRSRGHGVSFNCIRGAREPLRSSSSHLSAFNLGCCISLCSKSAPLCGHLGKVVCGP